MERALGMVTFTDEAPPSGMPKDVEPSSPGLDRTTPWCGHRDWRVRPHVHADKHHIFLFAEGSGEISVNGQRRTFEGPVILIVPAGLVHSLNYPGETRGVVVTVSTTRLDPLMARHPLLHDLFGGVQVAPISHTVLREHGLEALIGALQDEEFRSKGPAEDMGLDGRLLTVLAAVARTIHASEGGAEENSPSDARLVANFRKLVEARLGRRWTIPQYAETLGVSPARLRTACVAVMGRPPLNVAHDRLVMEAKRLLAFSAIPIARIAYDLGFVDAAHFSRFFAQRAGEPPATYRRRSLANVDANPLIRLNGR